MGTHTLGSPGRPLHAQLAGAPLSSSQSLWLSAGKMRVRTLLRRAASVFSLTPPMGRMRPVSDTSPAVRPLLPELLRDCQQRRRELDCQLLCPDLEPHGHDDDFCDVYGAVRVTCDREESSVYFAKIPKLGP